MKAWLAPGILRSVDDKTLGAFPRPGDARAGIDDLCGPLLLKKQLRSFSLVRFFSTGIFLDARSPTVIWRAALVLLLDLRGAAVSLIPVLFLSAERIVFLLSGRRFLIVQKKGTAGAVPFDCSPARRFRNALQPRDHSAR